MEINPYQAPADTPPILPQSTSQTVWASQNKRFINFIVDNILLRLFSMFVGGGLGFAYGSYIAAQGRQVTDQDETMFTIVGTLVAIMLMLAYFIILEGLAGVTIGKLLTGTRVVTADGGRPRFSQIVGRSFARLIPLEPFSFLFGDTTTGWHDSLSGTRVVDLRK